MKRSIDIDVHSPTGVFQLENFLPYRLSVASETVSRLIARQYLVKSGLGMSEWRLLAVIGRFGVLSPTAAGERTAMDKVKVSRATASLVARGLVRQAQDPNDGRGRLLRLTRKGTAISSDMVPTANAIDSALEKGLTKAEWTTLHKTLGKLSVHAQSLLVATDEEHLD